MIYFVCNWRVPVYMSRTKMIGEYVMKKMDEKKHCYDNGSDKKEIPILELNEDMSLLLQNGRFLC